MNPQGNASLDGVPSNMFGDTNQNLPTADSLFGDSANSTNSHIIRVHTHLSNPKANRSIKLGALRSKGDLSFKEDLLLLIRHTRDQLLFSTHNGRLNNAHFNKDQGHRSILHGPKHHLLNRHLFHQLNPQETNF
ncbi:hypothetical protein BGZ93_004980 [Podila epicladia]|nr:hypothetical protein BGZ92_007180 [Podila epicladia]KAG0096127.1 hypothetical protein BGZ93_004980 [Podila epicladia]